MDRPDGLSGDCHTHSAAGLGPLIIRPFIPITWSWLSTLQILVGGGLLLYVLFGPLITVRVWRVAPLPMWLEPWGENEPLLLEAVRIKEPQAKEYNTVEIAKESSRNNLSNL